MGQALAAQYTAGLQAANRRMVAENEDKVITSAKVHVMPFLRRQGESELVYSHRMLAAPLPRSHSMSTIAKAFQILEQRNSALRLSLEDGRNDMINAQEEAAEDVRLLDLRDAEIAKMKENLSAMKRRHSLQQYSVMLLCFLCLTGGALAKPHETTLALPIHVCRAVGLYVLCALFPFIDARIPRRADTTEQDDSSKPAHQLAPSPADRIRKFYEKHCPSKLDDAGFVDRVAKRYSYPGGYDALFASLNKKYN